MNIKSLATNISPLDTRLRTDSKESARLKNTGERDPNGQRQQDGQESKRHLDDQEFNEAIQILRENKSIIESHLVIRVGQFEDHRVIYIEDPAGLVIRRLSEADLWLVTRDKNRPTGKILDRAG